MSDAPKPHPVPTPPKDVSAEVPKPHEVDPESGTDAAGDPVENPSG